MKCLRALVLVLVPLLGGRSGAAEPLDQWQLRTNPAISNNLNAVTFGDDRFVAVGIKGTIAWSSDGATWLPVASGTTRDLFSVAHGNGVFVAGATGNRFFVSNDGLDWTERTTPSPDSPNWYGLTFGDGQFVAVSWHGVVATSPDGDTWQIQGTGTDDRLVSVTHGNGMYVAAGYQPSPSAARIYSSPDGLEWTSREPSIGSDWLLAVGFGGGQFVTAGEGGKLSRSPDGVTWTPVSSGISSKLREVVHGPAGFVVVADGGRLRTSSDGTGWVGRTSGTTRALFGAAYGAGRYVAVGFAGEIIQSGLLAGGDGELVIEKPVRNGAQFSFQFAGDPGRTYHVEATEDLARWSRVTSVVGTGAPMIVTLPDQTQPHRIYRLLKP